LTSKPAHSLTRNLHSGNLHHRHHFIADATTWQEAQSHTATPTRLRFTFRIWPKRGSRSQSKTPFTNKNIVHEKESETLREFGKKL